ncbi:hypothetical protein DPMN_035584 [Dreissena polymorpha]|uniref:Uncharacterized protein n=1 Tax=Dreissena polymorpha TaxID=45954 RepID=A0A9D4RM37_DREPO|nr:hypothetical protein DPMN_035584 [Dreissena polymorpha]
MDDGDSSTTPCKTACKDSNQPFGQKFKGIECGFCENSYCQKCTKLKTQIFNEIGKEESILFSCVHCRIAMPFMRKIITKMESLETRVDKLEKSLGNGTCDKNIIKDIIRQDKEEEQNHESRRLNVVENSLTEHSEESIEGQKERDTWEVNIILNDTLNLNVKEDKIIRLGKFSPTTHQRPRTLRFTVSNFEDKRSILRAASKLKNHEKYSGIYLTHDLTPAQRKISFDLQTEKRQREKNGEKT